MNDTQMLERVAAEVRGFVERKFSPLMAEVTRLRDALEQQSEAHARRVEAMERSLAAVELKQGPAGRDGVDGKDGLHGKDGSNGVDGANGKDGRDGIDGKDGLDGKDGADGKDGRDGIDGKDGLDGKNGADGKDGNGVARIELDPDMRHFDIVLDDGRRFEVQLPEGVKGDPGRNGTDGRDGKDGRDGLHGKDGRDGIDGKDGAPGASGVDGIDGKNGERGVRGESGADGVDGKDGADGRDGRDGVQLDDFDASIEGRSLKLRFALSDGITKEKELILRGMVLDRGVYRSATQYQQGDAVTYAGSSWIAQCDTEKSPGGGNSDWRLAVKRGRDGKDATGGDE